MEATWFEYVPVSAFVSWILEDEAENFVVSAAAPRHVDCCQKRTQLSHGFAETPPPEVEVEIELRARSLLWRVPLLPLSHSSLSLSADTPSPSSIPASNSSSHRQGNRNNTPRSSCMVGSICTDCGSPSCSVRHRSEEG